MSYLGSPEPIDFELFLAMSRNVPVVSARARTAEIPLPVRVLAADESPRRLQEIRHLRQIFGKRHWQPRLPVVCIRVDAPRLNDRFTF